MKKSARGYIASGEFNGIRVPQHIQNQVIKNYCDANNLLFVLSRAEYWINGGTQCQLWAALKEGYEHIVFFSLWQLSKNKIERLKIYEHCSNTGISLHFAVERLHTKESADIISDIEIIIATHSIISRQGHGKHLELLQTLL